MNWGSFSEFVAMGGYGAYVWGSFGVTAAAFAIEVMFVRGRRDSVLQRLRRQSFADGLEEQPA